MRPRDALLRRCQAALLLGPLLSVLTLREPAAALYMLRGPLSVSRRAFGVACGGGVDEDLKRGEGEGEGRWVAGVYQRST